MDILNGNFDDQTTDGNIFSSIINGSNGVAGSVTGTSSKVTTGITGFTNKIANVFTSVAKGVKSVSDAFKPTVNTNVGIDQKTVVYIIIGVVGLVLLKKFKLL
jgi:phage-related protein